MWDTISSIIPLGICYTAPLLIIALGGLISERSGVVNIGLEGILGMGAFASAYVIWATSEDLGSASIWIGLIAAALAGGVFALIHAFASITLKADQVVSGTAINILSMALTIYLARIYTGSGNIQIKETFIKSDIPVLSDIPVIGLLFKDSYITTFLVLVIVFIIWSVLYRMPFGLRLRACGENPQAADSLGINVIKMRYISVFMSGVLAGLGGGIVLTTYSSEFSQSIYNGLGFLALAALIFGKWKPFGVLAAALFFGIAKTSADISQVNEVLKTMPSIIFTTFPYVVTLIALVIFSKNSAGPKAAGEPFDPGKR